MSELVSCLATSSPDRFRFRWQFSLRAILILMLGIGAALTIYRWPWQVTEESQFHSQNEFGEERLWWLDRTPKGPLKFETKTISSYRTVLRGEPLLDGPQRLFVGEQLVRERMYRSGVLHGETRCYNLRGELTEVTQYRQGRAHGPHRIGDGQRWMHIGQYVQEKHNGVWDQRDGEWLVLEDHKPDRPGVWMIWHKEKFMWSGRPEGSLSVSEDYVQVKQHWNRGKRTGRWEWRAPSGELLNTAEYDAAEQLTHWNGKPVVRDFWSWVDRELAVDPELQKVLRGPRPEKDSQHMTRWMRGSHEDWFVAEPPDPYSALKRVHSPRVGEAIVVHMDRTRHGSIDIQATQRVGLNYLETALFDGLKFEYRYGGLWFVRAEDFSDGFQDPTGAADVKFEPGSAQARDWETPVRLYDRQSVGALTWLQYLLNGSSIALDSSALELDKRARQREIKPERDTGCYCLRRRRDAVGLILFRSGLRCVQEGNTLRLRPHWTGLQSYQQFDGQRVGSFVFD